MKDFVFVCNFLSFFVFRIVGNCLKKKKNIWKISHKAVACLKPTSFYSRQFVVGDLFFMLCLIVYEGMVVVVGVRGAVIAKNVAVLGKTLNQALDGSSLGHTEGQITGCAHIHSHLQSVWSCRCAWLWTVGGSQRSCVEVTQKLGKHACLLAGSPRTTCCVLGCN